MGRKSKLSIEQWAEVERRILEGEAVRALAREFGVSEAAIRERIAKYAKVENVQAVARKIVDAELSLAALPIAAQITAQNLAARLRAISDNLAGAAHYGAATAHRLAGMANAKVNEIDDAAPLTGESIEALRGVATLTKMANESATIGLNLIAANKDKVKQLNEATEAEAAAAVSSDPLEAAQAYMKVMGG
jgi:hypothetical protein